MKPIINAKLTPAIRVIVLFCAACFLGAFPSHGGLTVQIVPTRYNYQDNYYYSFSINLFTNGTLPNVAFGNYFISSQPITNGGSSASFQYDTNGFNGLGGGGYGYNDFPTLMYAMTNGLWSLTYSTSTNTNVYYFAVSSTLTSNALTPVVITYPTNGAANIPDQPTFTWSGTTNDNQQTAYISDPSGNYNYGNFLPPSQRSLPSPAVLHDGPINFTVHLQTTNAGVITTTVPTNTAAQSQPAWAYDSFIDDYFVETFTVGTLDTSGSGHTLVAHYAFDGTTGFGGVSGADTSGNGYNTDFGGSYGSQGGVTSTTTSVAGGRALNVHDGDNNSAGYIGWSNTPAGLLGTLSGSFTLSCWIRTSQNFAYDGAPAYQSAGILAADVPGLANDLIPLALSGSKIAFSTGGSIQDDYLVSQTGINDGNFHHIVITRNQFTGQKVVYVDGAVDDWTSGTTNILSAPQKITIGALADASNPNPNDGSYYNGFDGIIDDLQIYSGLLSSSEVNSLFNNPGATVPDGSSGITLAEAVDATNLVWTTSGDSLWFGESATSHDSVSAAQSGAVTGSQSSVLQTIITGPGVLSFWWQTSANDSNFDLEFDIDGSYYDDISQMTSWTQDTFSVGPGTHTLTWTATANTATDPTDTGWVDQFVFNQGSAPVITVDPFSQTNYPGYTAALYAQASGSAPITWQWYEIGLGALPGATNALFVPTNSGTPSVAGSYYATAANGFGSASSSMAQVTFVNTSAPPNWSKAFNTPWNNNNSPSADYILAMLMDTTGNLYSVGELVGTNTIGATTFYSPNNSYSAEIVKQTPAGAFLWAVTVTNNGLGNSDFHCIAAAPGNGIYVAGNFNGTNWIGGNRFSESAGGGIFIARFDSTGSNIWFKTITGTNVIFTEYFEIASDPSGNVTLSGLGNNTTSLGTTNLPAVGQQGFLAQYDLNGNLKWAQLTPSWLNYLTYGGGQLFGSFANGSTNFTWGAINVTTDRARSIGAFNASNGQPVWIKGIGEPFGVGNPFGIQDDIPYISVSGSNVFITGTSFGNGAAFGPFSVNFPQTGGQYFGRCDTNGNPELLTQFGSPTTIIWGMVSDAAGNSYVTCDFDTYTIFGNDVLGAPHLDSIGNGYYSASCMAKFNSNGVPYWVRPAQTPQFGLVNLRGIALAPDGIWANGLVEGVADFGTNVVTSMLTCIGSPICNIHYQQSGVLAKITDASLTLPVTLFGMQQSGTNFEFSFVSQAGRTHTVLSRTNLSLGSWITNSVVAGDGTTKLVIVPDKGTNEMFFKVGTQ